MEVVVAITQTKRFQQLKNLLALVAVVKFGGDFWRTMTELGMTGSFKALLSYLFKTTLYYGKKLPFVKGQVEAEINKALKQLENQIMKDERAGQYVHFNDLLQTGMTKEQIMEELQKHREMAHHKWEEGKMSGCVYHGGKDLTDVVTAASNLFEWSNPLHCDAFPGLRKLEAEVVSMVVKMFNGTPGACGSMTSGGTESIIMAVRAHKEWARETKNITRPHLIMSYTAHVAFDKACEYFGIRITHLPVDPKTRQLRLSDVRAAITPNTIMVVGSCPSFPWGTIDDIQGLGKIAQEYNIGLHVDCCLGSFVVAFMEQSGFPLPLFDFRVPGVTSISCDTHKFGFAPKGSSVVMYRNSDLRRYQYFAQPNWPGGIYASPTVAGSRPGQLVAGCWAALMYHGKEGYIKSCQKIIGSARKITAAVRAMRGIQVIGEPLASVVAFESAEADIYRISDGMNKKGWNINNLQYPPAFHICCTYMTDADQFISDLKEVMDVVLQNPEEKATGGAAIYGMSAAIPDRSLIDRIARGYIDTMYLTDK
eukprot:TRINITY_DN12734_c0_g1_i1.p1 TRINITY_DN12734_c0_g1~~TRINITY_DN12734_c0_g1_i1.p1  ORF type:complete len:544 (-),score=109.59 TRINITY_DN12734_c0_g1_i1:44-1654(-)